MIYEMYCNILSTIIVFCGIVQNNDPHYNSVFSRCKSTNMIELIISVCCYVTDTNILENSAMR